MSVLWRQTAEDRWESLSLAEYHNGLSEGIRIVPFGSGPERGVGLLVRQGCNVRVNGHPVLGGFRVLEHKDEILIGRTRLYFSAESTPLRVLFRLEQGMRWPTCPVCRGPVRDGEQAVQCPGCGRWFHQLEGGAGQQTKTCWTYAATCRFCGHPTALTGEAAWHPEMEEDHV